MAKIPIILEAGRADGKLIKTNSVYDDNQEKFLSDKIKEIDDNHNNLKNEVNELTNVVNNNESDIETKLETEKTRATNAENNLIETINNITNINEHATTAELITVNTLPNTSSSNVQQALNELFKNETFAGIAIPTTDPGVPNSSVFYLANNAGVYINFNNIEVLNGELTILEWNNNTWTKCVIKPMTDFNSVFNADGNSLTYELNTLENKIFIPFDKIKEHNGFMSSDNKVTNFVSKHKVISVNEGQEISIVGNLTNVSLYAYLGSYTEPKSIIETYDRIGSRNSIPIGIKVDSVVPKGAKYLFVITYNETTNVTPQSILIDGYDIFKNVNNSIVTLQQYQNAHNSIIKKIEDKIPSYDDVVNEVNGIDKEAKEFGFESGYRTTSGIIYSINAYFHTIPIKLNEGDIVSFDNIKLSVSISALSSVTDNGTFIRTIYAGKNVEDTYEYVCAKEEYVEISCLVSESASVYIKKKGIKDVVPQNEKIISKLNEFFFDSEINASKYETERSAFRIASSLALGDNSSYWFTKPIKVLKGDKVITTQSVKIGSVVSIITEVDEDNNGISMLLGGVDENKVIEYTIPKDCYISICNHNNSRGLYIVKKQGAERKIESIENTISSLKPDSASNIDSINNDNPLATIKRMAGYGGIIHSWGIIGDSLSSGEMQCYDNTSTSATDYKFVDMYQWSWGQRFGQLIRADVYNYSNGGQTTHGWLKGQGEKHDETYDGGIGGGNWIHAKNEPKQGYIIALGVNDRLRIERGEYSLGDVSHIVAYDGTNSDIDDTSTNSKSFVRYYAGIIQRIKSIQPKAKIFCITPLGDNYADIAQAIRNIVELYEDVYLIDLAIYCPIKWQGEYNLNGHGSAIGYEYTMYEINTYIDWIIRKNPTEFMATALIGTKYRGSY